MTDVLDNIGNIFEACEENQGIFIGNNFWDEHSWSEYSNSAYECIGTFANKEFELLAGKMSDRNLAAKKTDSVFGIGQELSMKTIEDIANYCGYNKTNSIVGFVQQIAEHTFCAATTTTTTTTELTTTTTELATTTTELTTTTTEPTTAQTIFEALSSTVNSTTPFMTNGTTTEEMTTSMYESDIGGDLGRWLTTTVEGISTMLVVSAAAAAAAAAVIGGILCKKYCGGTRYSSVPPAMEMKEIDFLA